MCFFTIFTATYNRAYCLENLKASLDRQKFTDYEWIIIDDGSTDNTKDIVSNWARKNSKIKYFKKNNEGKPRAINYGIKLAQGRYFIMVDSDDMLSPDALEKVHQWCLEIDDNESVIGVGAARGKSNGTYLKGSPPKIALNSFVDATNLERRKYNLDADMCEAYKTDIFRKYPMAEWPNEKFAPEQIALNNIALDGYKIRWRRDIIYICEYLNDGLTKNSKILEKNNPMGYSMMYNHMLLYPDTSIKEKIYYATQSIALALYGKNGRYILNSYNPIISFIVFPLGFVLAIRRSIQYRRM